MIRSYLSTSWVALFFLSVGATWGQIAAAVEPARALETSSAGQRPALAVIASVDEMLPQEIEPLRTSREDLEDLLVMEIGNQPFLKLVDRQSLAAVMKEHAIALSNLGEANKAVALGKFAKADYLLHVVVRKDTASARLVETDTGQVKLDEEVKLNADLALFAAAVREKVLAVLRPESKIGNYLTVGITEFPNRSGNPTSDKLGLELQTALRKRLKNQSWAVVLERQYPTALIEEVDLARMGFTRGKGTDSLPPADFVILGSLEDAGREYEPGKPWEVTLRLTLRLRGRASQIEKRCRSDAIEAAADDLLREIDAFRREKPLSDTNVPEKELWRRQAFYIMPERCETWGNAIVPNFCAASQTTQLETLRAWENVLLLDADDPEAMTYLGVCLIGFNWSSHSKIGAMRCIAGSQLVERAYRSHPNKVRAKTYVACIKIVMQAAPARAKEMAQYVADHPKEFKQDASMWWVKRALSLPDTENGRDADSYLAAWKRAIDNARQDPETLLYAFTEVRIDKPFPIEQAAVFMTPYLDSSDPMIQFLAQRTVGEFLCKKKKDPAGLEHLDKAISLIDEAYARCNKYGYLLNAIYRQRLEAGKLFDRVEDANKIALAAARRFLKEKRFDESINWLYLYCATDVLREGEEQEAIAFCDASLAVVKKHFLTGHLYWRQIAAKRQELLAKMAGKPVPDMSSLRLAKGTEGTDLVLFRMAGTDGKLWLVSGTFPMSGKAMIYRPDRDEVVPLPNLRYRVGSVVALNDSVFFGTDQGIYKFNGDGTLAKHYERTNSSLAGSSILDLCEGGGKIYFSFHGSPRQGIAVLDPDSETVTVLAPSSHEATDKAEPLMNIQRLRWDAMAPRLYAFEYGGWYILPIASREYQWSPVEKVWRPYEVENAACMVVSDGNETLVVQGTNDRLEFHFEKSGKKVKATVPASLLIGEPAWDDDCIWVPTPSGLYEVERATGRVAWLAYQYGNSFYSVLKHGNRLYVATARGLYYRGISPARVKE
jgi:hypothetical protein